MIKRALTYILLAVFLAACSTTRYVPEGEQLYTGIRKIEFTDADINARSKTGQTAVDEVGYALKYAPNGSFMGSSSTRLLPVGLWFYNAFYNSRKGIGRWLFNSFATEPVLVSDVNPELRANVATDILRYYGYFNGKVEASINTGAKNPKKADITYMITLNEPSLYDTVAYMGFPYAVDTLISSTSRAATVKAGSQFNAAELEQERDRLSNLLRDNGYYHFQPSFIRYLADTINTPGKVNLRIQPTNSLPGTTYIPYKTGNINIRVMETGYSAGRTVTQDADTFTRRNFSYIYYGRKMPVRAGSILRNIPMRKGELYSQSRQQRTLQT